ncbi:hypothetical protein ACIBSW_13860 [Actinoplanes sp. NPDC049668]|uniref:hypothetical protein n=1 Tax=unclassified Actinoplanes TaxID=2626549 RepID=UPI0033B0D03A
MVCSAIDRTAIRLGEDPAVTPLPQRTSYLPLLSHSYLWDIETGRRQPTPDIAQTLDDALDADGILAELVTESPAVEAVDHAPIAATMHLLDTNRHHIEDVAQRCWSAADPGTRAAASQWAPPEVVGRLMIAAGGSAHRHPALRQPCHPGSFKLGLIRQERERCRVLAVLTFLRARPSTSDAFVGFRADARAGPHTSQIVYSFAGSNHTYGGGKCDFC